MLNNLVCPPYCCYLLETITINIYHSSIIITALPSSTHSEVFIGSTSAVGSSPCEGGWGVAAPGDAPGGEDDDDVDDQSEI